MNTQLRKYILRRKKTLGKIHIFNTSPQLSMMHASIGYFYLWFTTSQMMLKKYQICLTVKYLFDLRIFILLIVTTDIYQNGAPLVLNHSRCLLRHNLIFMNEKRILITLIDILPLITLNVVLWDFVHHTLNPPLSGEQQNERSRFKFWIIVHKNISHVSVPIDLFMKCAA